MAIWGLVAAIIVALAVLFGFFLVARSVPDIARYMRLRKM